MEIFVIWIGFGVVTAIAAARGRSFIGWLLIGRLTGIFGLIAVLVHEPGGWCTMPHGPNPP